MNYVYKYFACWMEQINIEKLKTEHNAVISAERHVSELLKKDLVIAMHKLI